MNVRIGHATYTHKVTGEKYEIIFGFLPHETELSKAWDLVSLAARLNGWRAADVAVACKTASSSVAGLSEHLSR